MKVVKVYGALRKRLGQCRFEFDVAYTSAGDQSIVRQLSGFRKVVD